VWLDLDDVTAHLDVKKLEDLFPNQTAVSAKKSKTEKKETKTLLDHNRAKNLGTVSSLCLNPLMCISVC